MVSLMLVGAGGLLVVDPCGRCEPWNVQSSLLASCAIELLFYNPKQSYGGKSRTLDTSKTIQLLVPLHGQRAREQDCIVNMREIASMMKGQLWKMEASLEQGNGVHSRIHSWSTTSSLIGRGRSAASYCTPCSAA
jgi:hypothetical protein